MVSALLLVLAGAAGCASALDDPEPSQTGGMVPVGPVAKRSPSASPVVPEPGTTTASVRPAPLPPAARQRTAKGAEAFVRHFLAEYNRAVTTPAVGLLRPLSLQSCATCHGFEDDVQALIRDHERYKVTPLRVDGVTCVACGAEQVPAKLVHAWVYSRPAEIVDRDDKVVQTIDPSSDILQFEVRWKGDGWAADKVKLASMR